MDLTLLALNTLKLIHGMGTSDWTVVVSGISIVLGTLFLLILVFYAFGAVISKTEAVSKKRAAKKLEKKMAADMASAPAVTPKAEPVPVAVPAPVPVVEDGISGEVVAAISAAVYSMEGSNATISAIRKQNPITARNPWAQAAVIDNTRPF